LFEGLFYVVKLDPAVVPFMKWS